MLSMRALDWGTGVRSPQWALEELVSQVMLGQRGLGDEDRGTQFVISLRCGI